MSRVQVTYAAVGNLGGEYANTNFSQRVMLAPEEVDLVALVRRGTTVTGAPPSNVRLLPARLPTLPGFYLHVFVRLAGRLGRRSQVVVTDRSAASIAGWLLRRVRRYRWVADLWDVPHKELVADYASRRGPLGVGRRLASRAKVAALGFLLRRADLVLASVLPAALDRYRLDADRVRSFTNAVDLEQLGAAPEGERRPRSLCYVTSRFVSDRGLDVLLDAVEQMQTEIGLVPSVALAGTIADEARRRIEASPAADSFEILGHVDLATAHEVIGRSELGVAPFRSNEDLDHTFPIKLYEYMALGCVVVASDLPGIRAALGEEPAGVLVEPGDPLDLARAIAALLDDPDRCEELRAVGRQRAARFDARHKMRDVYASLTELVRPAAE